MNTDSNIYECPGNTFLPIYTLVGQEGALFPLASSGSESDQLQLASQGADGQQISLPQILHRTSDQQSSLSSFEGVGVSGISLS
jgi:hypothetical protein